jgi:hypothetical protein
MAMSVGPTGQSFVEPGPTGREVPNYHGVQAQRADKSRRQTVG